MVLNDDGHDGQNTKREEVLGPAVLKNDSAFIDTHVIDEEDNGACVEAVDYESQM